MVSQARSESKPAASYEAGAAIVIDASKPLPYKIPAAIFGTFLEPIGNSIYGGLWADELANPPNLVSRFPGNRSIQGARYEPRWGDAANSSRSLPIMGAFGKGDWGPAESVFAGSS